MRAFLLFFILLIGSTGLLAEEIPEETKQGIRQNAELVMKTLSEASGAKIDLSGESVKWVAGFINRNRDQTSNRMVSIIGSYLGEAIINQYGGKWVIFEGVPAVEITPDLMAFPFNKVQKQYANGSEDSIYGLFTAIGEQAKQAPKTATVE